jgi:hypothetical protein
MMKPSFRDQDSPNVVHTRWPRDCMTQHSGSQRCMSHDDVDLYSPRGPPVGCPSQHAHHVLQVGAVVALPFMISLLGQHIAGSPGCLFSFAGFFLEDVILFL